MPPKDPNWYTFGWHGITFDVPKEWNLGKLSGEFRTGKSGYLRLDDAEIARVEVEWRESKRGEPPISRFVDKYVQNLEKKAQKRGVELKVNRKSRLLKDRSFLEGKDYDTFTWEADYRAYNLTWRCRTCHRVVLIRVLARMEENLSALAAKVMASVQDHSEDGRIFWGVYDLACTVPEGYILEEYALKSGLLGLTFEQKHRSLKVECISLADIALKHVSIGEWFDSFCRKALRDLKYSYEEAEIDGHPGLRVTGAPKSLWKQVFRPVPFVSKRPRRYLDAQAWHCTESNKIFVIQAFSKQKGDLSSEVVDIDCHGKEASHSGGDVEVASGEKSARYVGA